MNRGQLDLDRCSLELTVTLVLPGRARRPPLGTWLVHFRDLRDGSRSALAQAMRIAADQVEAGDPGTTTAGSQP